MSLTSRGATDLRVDAPVSRVRVRRHARLHTPVPSPRQTGLVRQAADCVCPRRPGFDRLRHPHLPNGRYGRVCAIGGAVQGEFSRPDEYVRPFRPAPPLLPAHASTAQISFASNYFYDFGLGLPKLSMLAFYWASFNLGRRRAMRKMLWGTTAFVVACYLTSLFDDTFFCGRDVSVQWSQEDGACSVFYAQEPFILNFSLGLACYLAIYAVPVVLLLQGLLKASAGVMVTFAFGALAIASGTVRFICLKVGTGQENLVCEYFDCLFHYPLVSALRCLCRTANGPSHQW
jgi:hypothetical protein